MTTGLLTIVQPGIGTTVQDRGRHGHRHEGVAVSGWLDGPLAEAANTLLGNPGGAAALELRGLGTELKVGTGPVRVAMAGRISAKWLRADGGVSDLLPWQSQTLQTGDRLVLGAAETGCAYLAASGGLQPPAQLGSRSSNWRAGLQGVLGRPLRPGDQLPCSAWTTPDPKQWRAPTPWTLPAGPVRVMLGPQADHFQPDAVDAFLHDGWEASAEQDRMGMRLRGTPLAHTSPQAADIVSDGGDRRRDSGARQRATHCVAGRQPDGGWLPQDRHRHSCRPAPAGTPAAWHPRALSGGHRHPSTPGTTRPTRRLYQLVEHPRGFSAARFHRRGRALRQQPHQWPATRRILKWNTPS